MDIKIIEPIKKPLVEFASIDEFNIYYNKHKDEIDNETTHTLNKKFRIPGYRITKIKGEICLKKDKPNTPAKEDRVVMLANRVNLLTNHIEQIENTLNKVIDIINRNTQEMNEDEID